MSNNVGRFIALPSRVTQVIPITPHIGHTGYPMPLNFVNERLVLGNNL